jgi:hypothetical protein
MTLHEAVMSVANVVMEIPVRMRQTCTETSSYPKPR